MAGNPDLCDGSLPNAILAQDSWLRARVAAILCKLLEAMKLCHAYFKGLSEHDVQSGSM